MLFLKGTKHRSVPLPPLTPSRTLGIKEVESKTKDQIQNLCMTGKALKN